MPRTKNEVLTIRTTADVKALLKLAAERERRSALARIASDTPWKLDMVPSSATKKAE